MNRNKWIAPIAIVCAALICMPFVGAAKGAVAETHIKHLRSIPAIAITATSSADATTWAAPIRPLPVGENADLAVEAEFSTAAATCVISVGLYYLADDGVTYTFLGFAGAAQTATATASGVTNGSGNFPATTLLKWTNIPGATHFDVRIAAPSAGTVKVRPWPFGCNPNPN